MAPTRKIYALKRIRLGGRDGEAAAGFIDEIGLLQRLRNKPNIIQLIDAEACLPCPYQGSLLGAVRRTCKGTDTACDAQHRGTCFHSCGQYRWLAACLKKTVLVLWQTRILQNTNGDSLARQRSARP